MDDLLNAAGMLIATISNLVSGLLSADKSMQILAVLCAILILLLILLVRSFMTGGKVKAPVADPGLGAETQASGMAAPSEPHLSHLMLEQPDASVDKPEALMDPLEGQQTRNSQFQTEPSMEEFKIFKRPQPPKSSTTGHEEHTVPLAHELEMIESNMVRLKDMFHEGHITRDVYVDETRTLYHQAKSLIKQG